MSPGLKPQGFFFLPPHFPSYPIRELPCPVKVTFCISLARFKQPHVVWWLRLIRSQQMAQRYLVSSWTAFLSYFPSLKIRKLANTAQTRNLCTWNKWYEEPFSYASHHYLHQIGRLQAKHPLLHAELRKTTPTHLTPTFSLYTAKHCSV